MNRTLAISDIHGMYDLWQQVIDSLDETDTLYVLGDCGDRGPDGWKIMKEALRDTRVRYILGNHDVMLLDSWQSGWGDEDMYLWFCNGGATTFDSITTDIAPEIYLRQLNKMPYLMNYTNKQGQIIALSHAGFTPSDYFHWNEDLVWDRSHIADPWPQEHNNAIVVHGHTPIPTKYFKNIDGETNDTETVFRYCGGHKICIDAGCFATKHIALLDLDTLTEEVFTCQE